MNAIRPSLQRHYWPAIVLILVTLALGGQALAQSPLGEVARKEGERRKSQPPAGKVYTDKDLPASAQKPALPPATEPAAATETAAPPAAEPAPAVTAPQGEAKDEAWWKGRIMGAREELRRNEIFAEALQSRINALAREYALPLGGAKRIAVGEQRAEALSELDRVKQDIDRGKKQIADIEEEARKAAVPPGWLR